MSTPLPDAAPTNWVDRYAPPALRPWLKLGRLDRPAGIWLLMLPGWQGIALAAAMQGRWPDWKLLVLFLLGATLMRSAGCAYNDIVDRDLDAKVVRTAGRPIPSGQISVGQAWAFVIACSLMSLLILLMLQPVAFLYGVASLALVAIYPFMKRITWWPQAWLGLTFNWGALLGFVAARWDASTLRLAPLLAPSLVTGTGLALLPAGIDLAWAAVLLYASGFFWTLGYDTIYAVQDLEDDALAGVKSSARRLGAAAPRAVLIFYMLCFALVLAMAFVARLGPLFWPVAAIYGAHLSRQATRLKVDDPAGALALFKSNGLAGLLLFLAIAAGSVGAGWSLP